MRVVPWLEAYSAERFGDSTYSGGGNAGATLFTPIAQDPANLLFTQIDGTFFFGDDLPQGGVTLGYRHLFDSLILGAHAGFDMNRSAGDNTFSQVAFGLEALGKNFDAHANAYLPQTDAQASPLLASIDLSGSSISMVGAAEVPMRGFDWDFAGKVFASSDDRFQFWAHGGGFYYEPVADMGADAFSGPEYGVEWRVADPLGVSGSRLTLGLGGRWDKEHGNRFSAGLGFRVAFGGSPSIAPDTLAARLAEPVRRSHDIALGQSREQVKDALTNVLFDRVDYSSSLDAGDLGGAVAAAPENTLLIVNEDYTTPQTISSGSHLTIAGAGTTLALTGATTGTPFNYALPGMRPSISVTGSSGILTALTIGGADNTIGGSVHIAGLNITATHSSLAGVEETTGIYVDELKNPIYLDDLSVLAQATISPAGASDAHVHAIYALDNYSMSDDSAIVTVMNSDLEGRFSGTFNGSTSNNAASEVRVYGIRSHDSQLSVQNSILRAFSNADLIGGAGNFSNTTLGLYGIRSSGKYATTNVSNSSLIAEFAGSLTGNMAAAPPSKSTLQAFGLFATDMKTVVDRTDLAVRFNGTMDTQSSAELYPVEYQGPGTGTTSLTLTNSNLSITGADSANWGSFDITQTGIRFDAVTTSTSTVLLADNIFSGVFDKLVSLNSGYEVHDGSTGNTASSAATTTVCYDGGMRWIGTLELNGAFFDRSNCSN